MQIFLEDQTEKLVGSIQSLVSSIRAEDAMGTIRTHINDIAHVVGKVVRSTEGTMSQSDLAALQDRGEPIIDKLSNCRARLLQANEDSVQIRNPASLREFTKQLPPLAFEIARETKVSIPALDEKLVKLYVSADGGHGVGVGPEDRSDGSCWWRGR